MMLEMCAPLARGWKHQGNVGLHTDQGKASRLKFEGCAKSKLEGRKAEGEYGVDGRGGDGHRRAAPEPSSRGVLLPPSPRDGALGSDRPEESLSDRVVIFEETFYDGEVSATAIVNSSFVSRPILLGRAQVRSTALVDDQVENFVNLETKRSDARRPEDQ